MPKRTGQTTRPPNPRTVRYLCKAAAKTGKTWEKTDFGNGGKEFTSGDRSQGQTGSLGNIAPKMKPSKHGQTRGKKIQTDVWGLTVGQLTKELKTWSNMPMQKMASSPELLEGLGNAAFGLSNITIHPPPELCNMLRMLGCFSQFCKALGHMQPMRAEPAYKAMTSDFRKMLVEFEERLPDGLKELPIRPPGNGQSVDRMRIPFPQQYQPLPPMK